MSNTKYPESHYVGVLDNPLNCRYHTINLASFFSFKPETYFSSSLIKKNNNLLFMKRNILVNFCFQFL